MIPPRRIEDEVDQRRMRGGKSSLNPAKFSSVVLWSCAGDLLRPAGSSWSSETLN